MADRRLQVFHAVAKYLSFTKAGETLFMSQPAVTFQIRQLEEHFNTRLFDRAQGRIVLTDAGKVAFDYCARIMALSTELDNRMKEISGKLAGTLLIGASTTIADVLLPQFLGEFKARHPGIIPRLIVANSKIVQERVAERALDLGFIEGVSHLPSLMTQICGEDELQVVCTPSHPLAQMKAVPAKSLTEHEYAGREPGSGTRQVIDRYLQAEGVPPDSLSIFMELGSPEALKRLVATGLGFAIMSRLSVDKEIRLGELVHIPLSPPLVRSLSLVFPNERIQSRLVDYFVAFAKERLAALQAPRSPAAG